MAKVLTPQEVRERLRPILKKLPNHEAEKEFVSNELSVFEEKESPFSFQRENKKEAQS